MDKLVADLLKDHGEAIEAACRQFDVEKLGLFGSGAASGFNPSASDLDFLVTFRRDAASRAFDNYFGLLESLHEILGHEVDLVTAASVRNPYLRREIEQSLVPIYAANAPETAS